jgi:hypothetical protein
MMRSRIIASLAAFLLLGPVVAGRAAADNVDEARAYVEKATAAYALNKYAAAAENFEKAFELKPDPALLYNAAQSHRLAGNKQRALTLYQNYLRVYGRDERRPQIELRIEELKKAIEKDRTEVPVPPPAGWPPGSGPSAGGAKAGANTPPNLHAAEPAKPLTTSPTATTPSPAPAATPPAPAPIALAPMPTTPPPPPAVTLTSSPPPSSTLLTQSSSSGEASGNDEGSLTHKPWFWVAVGGGVAAAVTVVLLLTLSKAKDPSASFGQINGN